MVLSSGAGQNSKGHGAGTAAGSGSGDGCVRLDTSPSPDGQPSVAAKHAAKLQEIRRQVFRLQDREYQLTALHSRVGEYANTNYPAAAAKQICAHLDHIFGGSGIERCYQAPRALEALMGSTPCLLTAFPGLGTHKSIPQGDIVLTDRFSTVNSRADVRLDNRLVPGGGFEQKLPVVVASMRSAIDEPMIEACLAQGITPVMHRFRRPTDPTNVDTESPSVESREEADAHKLRLAQRFGQNVFMSCGTSWGSIEFAKRMMLLGVGGICVDVALGNSAGCAATLIELANYANEHGLSTRLMAGNVDTEEGYYLLALAGAHVIKVGIGPGSACTTRGVTRAGAGQGSALMSVAKGQFMMGPDAPAFIADGGIKSSADILVSLALGAQAAMIGNLAATCHESGGLKRQVDGKLSVWYHGEASRWARIYEDGQVRPGMAVEGDARWIPVRGTVAELVTELSGGLRNAFPYYNATDVEGLRRRFSIPQQLCDLILGQTTGIYVTTPSHQAESKAHFAQQ